MKLRPVRILIGIILILIGVLAFCQFNFSKSLPAYRQQWSFTSSELQALSLNGNNQAIQISFVPSTDGKNTIVLEGHAAQEVIDRIHQTNLEGGTLAVDLNRKHGFWPTLDWFRDDQQVLTLSLTDEARAALASLSVKSDSGSLHMEGGGVLSTELRTDSGSIHVSDFAGRTLKLSSDSGSIHADDIQADLTASSDSGSINVQHLTGASALTSDSGSVKLLMDNPASSQIKTDSGSVKVTVPASYSGSYELKSDSGSIHAPDAAATSSDKIRVQTDSGSIRISSS